MLLLNIKNENDDLGKQVNKLANILLLKTYFKHCISLFFIICSINFADKVYMKEGETMQVINNVSSFAIALQINGNKIKSYSRQVIIIRGQTIKKLSIENID